MNSNSAFRSFIALIAWLSLLTTLLSVQSLQVSATPAPVPAPIPIAFPTPQEVDEADEVQNVPTQESDITEGDEHATGCPEGTIAIGRWTAGGPSTYDVILPAVCPGEEGYNTAYAHRKTPANQQAAQNLGLCGLYPGGVMVGCSEGSTQVARLISGSTGEMWNKCTPLPTEKAWCGSMGSSLAYVAFCCSK